MKLQELSASPTKQAAKVFESYFGGRVRPGNMTKSQARNLLQRVRGLVQEHRATPDFHHSERDPAYLKLIMMEQVLSSRLKEDMMPPPTQTQTQTQSPAQAAAMAAQNLSQKKKAAQDQLKQIDDQIRALQAQRSQIQQQMNSPTMENRGRRNSLYRRLSESEIQQAQVVLAAQDMVDRVQKILEDVTSMQFKDLPALADQIKNEVGAQQAAQFNQDAAAALGGLVQNLQASKQQLEQALSVVTGQDAGMPPAMGAVDSEQPAMGEPEPAPDAGNSDLEADMDLDSNLGSPPAALGRGRR